MGCEPVKTGLLHAAMKRRQMFAGQRIDRAHAKYKYNGGVRLKHTLEIMCSRTFFMPTHPRMHKYTHAKQCRNTMCPDQSNGVSVVMLRRNAPFFCRWLVSSCAHGTWKGEWNRITIDSTYSEALPCTPHSSATSLSHFIESASMPHKYIVRLRYIHWGALLFAFCRSQCFDFFSSTLHGSNVIV